jgi:hypothetical protein
MKQKINKFWLLILTCLVAALNNANAENLPRESIVVQLSEQYLLAGEKVGFSVMVTNQKDLPGTQISNLAFVELLDNSSQSVIRQKIILENGIGSGVISLPDSLSTGIYSFVAYTSWLKNFGEKYFSVSQIMVVKPGDDFTPKKQNEDGKTYRKSQRLKNENLSLQLNKTTFSNREKVKVELNLEKAFDNAVVSVAVRKKEPAVAENGQVKSDSKLPVDKINFLPDYKGILLTGFLRNKETNQPMPGQQVFMSFPGESVEIKHTISEGSGRFRFLLEPAAGEKDMVFLAPSENIGIWLEDKFCDSLNIAALGSFVPDMKTDSFFTEKYINWQLQKKFQQENSATAGSDPEKYKPFLFYDDPAQVLKSEDYIQLDSLHEYFYELIPSVQLTRKNKKYLMRFSNSEKNYHFGNNPALFVDGVYYPYPGELMKTDATKIDRIEIIPEIYYYRDLTFDGIVSVFSKDTDFMDFQLLPNMTRVFYNLAEPAKKLQLPHLGDGIPSNIPDLRWLIFWNPEIEIERSSSKTLEFAASDVKGEFEISVSGITDEGKIIRAHQTFTVE